MSSHCHRREDCRLCGGQDLTLVLSLAPTPPANAFVPPDKLNDPQESFPLDLFFCNACHHVQLLDVVDPAILFEHYVYVSGTSPTFVDHFRRYAEDVIATYQPDASALIVDIGSNDGTLLKQFKERGFTVLGVDPAREIAAAATRDGVETWAEFFTPELAEQIVEEKGRAELITANNVFAHSDDLIGMINSVRRLLSPDGVFVFEVSYLADVIEKLLFDTIYHEHLAYHSVEPLIGFFRQHGMELIHVERVDTHGGSLRGAARLAGGSREVQPSVATFMQMEHELGLHQPETFRRFGQRIGNLGDQLRELLIRLGEEDKTIVGFGAPAKATTLMHQFGIDRESISFIVDDSPLKQGLYTPGLHIPVVSADYLAEQPPDYLLILAWNFAEPIMAKLKPYHDAGGQFIVPLPELTVQ